MDYQVAFDKIAQFETADEIADFFQGEQLRAHPKEAESCAIAKWMNDSTGLDVMVDAYDIDIYDLNKLTTIKTTKAMADFIGKFDELYYPELVDWEDM